MISALIAFHAAIAAKSFSFGNLTPAASLFLALIIALCAVIIVVHRLLSRAAKKKNARLDAAALEHYRAWRKSVSDGNLPEYSVPIHLRPGEICVFVDARATLNELQAVHTGNFGGTNFDVADGIGIQTGSFKSEAHDEWRAVTSGSLYVTNFRIIFDGEIRNHSIKISDVLSVVRAPRGALLNLQNRTRPIIFAHINGNIFADIVDAIARGGKR